jgi:hypothetical protein
MNEQEANPTLVAYCGLYCGQCRAYRKGRCPGCQRNDRAHWCAVRTCCREQDYESCADCTSHPNPHSCAKFHNAFSRLIGFVLDSDRRA